MKDLVCVTIIEDWWSCHLFSVLCRSVGDFEWKNGTNGGTHCIEFGVFFFFFLGKILNSELVLGTLTCEIFAGVANYFMARGDGGLGKSQKLKVEWRRVSDSHSVHHVII